jgi:ABC-type amino acid transport substrate-binding protein
MDIYGHLEKMTRFLLALAVLAALLPGHAAAERLLIGTNISYPPFSFVTSDGRHAGFEVELGNLLCQRIGADCDWIGLPFEELIPALLSRRIDLIMGSMSITPERRVQVSFTSKYYSTPVRFIGRNELPSPLSMEEIAGLRIGCVSASTHSAYLGKVFGEKVRPYFFETQNLAVAALLNGDIDLLIGDALPLWAFLDGEEGHRFGWKSAPIYLDEGIGAAFRPAEERLRQRFERAIREVLEDGSYARINARYFPFNIY